MLLNDLGQYDAARMAYEKARDLQQELAYDFPTVPYYRHELARTHKNLGALLIGLGESDSGSAEFERARDLQQTLADEYPAAPQYRLELARIHNNLASLLLRAGKHEEARTGYETALALKQKLVNEFPGAPAYQRDLAISHHNLANVLGSQDQLDVARTHYEAARDLQQKLADEFPATPQYRQELAGMHTGLGNLLLNLGQHEAAGAEYEKACDLLDKLAAAFPNVPEYQVLLGCSYNNRGVWLRDEDKSAESLTWYDLSIRTLTPVYEADRRSLKVKSYLRNSHANRAWAYDQLKMYAEGAKDWDKATELNPTPTYVALTVYREALRADPDNAWINYRLAWLLANRRETTLHEAKQAVRAAKKAVALDPQKSEYWRTLGVAQYRAESWQEAIQAITRSMELSHGGDAYDWLFLAMARWHLSDQEQALQWRDKAVAWMDQNGKEDAELQRFRAEADELLDAEN
jgi:tetratricopeptide (TPR) repeat protein